MKQQAPEILREKDVFGLEKPRDQRKPLKGKSKGAFVLILMILLVAAAAVMYYF